MSTGAVDRRFSTPALFSRKSSIKKEINQQIDEYITEFNTLKQIIS